MNKPYVKHFSTLGELLNPIRINYENPYPNRKQRRKSLGRFVGNNKGHSLLVVQTAKFFKVEQFEIDKDGMKKRILHYLAT